MTSLFSLLQPSPIPREGLPFWIFWLLLLIILLLFIFIFLREKELRQRLNFFFFKARKKVTRLRLLRKVRKEKLNKVELLKELGRKTWGEGIKPVDSESICVELKSLEEEKISNQKEIAKTESELDMLNKKEAEYRQNQEAQIKEMEAMKRPHEEKMTELKRRQIQIQNDLKQIKKEMRIAEKEKQASEKKIQKVEANQNLEGEAKGKRKSELEEKIKSIVIKKEEIEQKIPAQEEEKIKVENEREEVQKVIDDFNQKIKILEDDEKERTSEFEREIREWQKSKENIQKTNAEIEKQMLPCFESFGKKINELRVENEELAPLYSQIDRIENRIQELKSRIENL